MQKHEIKICIYVGTYSEAKQLGMLCLQSASQTVMWTVPN